MVHVRFDSQTLVKLSKGQGRDITNQPLEYPPYDSDAPGGDFGEDVLVGFVQAFWEAAEGFSDVFHGLQLCYFIELALKPTEPILKFSSTRSHQLYNGFVYNQLTSPWLARSTILGLSV